MNLGRGRARRPDDWPSSHVRARSALSDRLDWVLDPTEAAWLDAHLAACPDCRSIAAAYAAQRLELRSLLDRTPVPPRDLWARTAAAIESESRFRDGRARSTGWRNRRLAPSALLAAALVVAVAAVTLTSSQRPGSDGTTGSSSDVAAASIPQANASGASPAGATPIPVSQKIAYVSRSGGTYTIKTKNVDKVCPSPTSEPCDPTATTVDQPVALDQNVSTVIGSQDEQRLIVVNAPGSANSGTILVVPIGSAPPLVSATPSVAPSDTSASAPPSAVATPSRAPAESPTAASQTPSTTPDVTPTTAPSVAVTPSPSPGGPIEIAHQVVLVGQSAAYSPTGDWFAFTARPSNDSMGPDIYVWKVGDRQANRVTSDHRSVFGSWSGEVMVGSTVVDAAAGLGAAAKVDLEPASYLLDPKTGVSTALPQTGRAWRPAVDPSGRLAVYWAGSVRATSDPGYAPDAGRLVLGDWGTGDSAPSDGPVPTALAGDQTAARHETTIEGGRMSDWDARWDATGTHLAVWIADTQNPLVGKLSLYTVDSFDGKIDLKSPLLDSRIATAGYSISNGKLVWAEPAPDGSTAGKIQLLAWTAGGAGTVETVDGPVIVIR